MRILKWLVALGVVVALVTGYVFMEAVRAGAWLDNEFAQLSRGWDAAVLVRDARSSSSAQGDLQTLQTALNALKQGHLRSVTPAACTFGLQFGSRAKDVGARAQCVLSATFDEGVVRFDFELTGVWNEWQIAGFEFQPEDQAGQDADSGG